MTVASHQKNRALVAHPLFFGLFPLFSMLSANLVWAGFSEVLLPAAVAVALALVLWFALWPLLPQPQKRGMVISLFWLPFYSYGFILDTLRDFFHYQDMFSRNQILAVAAILAALGLGVLYALRSTPRSFDLLTRILNHLSALILAVALLSCATTLAKRAWDRPAPHVPVVAGKPLDLKTLPNIYFIVADSYPRTDYLKSYFDFDNTPFLNQLKDRGFYIAERSRSNYPNTLPSLASTLNMDYLDNSIATEGWEEGRYYSALLGMIKENSVVAKLQDIGYEFVSIASGVFPTEMDNADRFIIPGGWRPTEYQQLLIDATPVRSILNRVKKRRYHHRVPFVFDSLDKLRSDGRPMFVFAHLLAPHLPHAYDADGNVLAQFPPYKQGWRQMTEFVDRRLISVVDIIQKNEPNSVIIIEGDHGPRTTWQDTIYNAILPWEGTWEDYIRDRSANLSTYYFPDRNYDGLLYPEITPVNTFRVIFNKYLGGDYNILEDVTYLSPQKSAEIVRVDKVY